MTVEFEERVRPVLGVVASQYELTPSTILSDSRLKSVTEARQVVMHLLRSVQKMSWTEVAVATRRKDHSTALTSVRRIRERMHNEPALKQRVLNLSAMLHQYTARVVVHIALPKPVLERLDALVASGCFGGSGEEAIERIVSTYVYENVGEVELKVEDHE